MKTKKKIVKEIKQLTPKQQKYLELCQKRTKTKLAKKRHRRPKVGITFVPAGDSPASYLVQRGKQEIKD